MSKTLTESDRAAVRQVWDNLIAANLATDWDACVAHSTDDLVHLDPRAEAIVGVGPWKEWAEAQAFADVDAQWNVHEVSGDGDLAYVRWDMAGSWKEGEEVVETRGKGISLFRRTPNGWRLSHNIWNATP